jgi:PPOX class probable F420-dependent enzyme
VQPSGGEAPLNSTMLDTERALAVALAGRYARLTSYRQNGKPVSTPIWFALDNGKAYFFTSLGTGKAKRIARSPGVQIGPSTMRGKLVGAEVAGLARRLEPNDENTSSAIACCGCRSALWCLRK